MVAHFTVRSYGVNKEFRSVEGIQHRKSRHIRFFFSQKTFYSTCVTQSELPSYISSMHQPFHISSAALAMTWQNFQDIFFNPDLFKCNSGLVGLK